MEGFGVPGFGIVSSFSRKRRSINSRRPRPDSQFLAERQAASPLSSTPSSDYGSKPPSDQDLGYDASLRRKEFNLSSTTLRIAPVSKLEPTSTPRKIRKEDKKYGDLSGFYGTDNSKGGQPGCESDMKRRSEGVLARVNWKSSSKFGDGFDVRSRSPDGLVGRHVDSHSSGHAVGGSNKYAENKLKNVKLKVVGVTNTIHTKSNPEVDNSGSSAKPSRSSDSFTHQHKLLLQDNSDEDHTLGGNSVAGVSWGASNGGDIPHVAKDSQCKASEDDSSGKQFLFSEPVRKSKRVPKKRILDGEPDDDHEDDEIRYLEKLKAQKIGTDYISKFQDQGEESVKKNNILKVSKCRKFGYNVDENYSSSRSMKEKCKRLRTGYNDTDYVEEEEPGSDDRIDSKVKKQKKESADTVTEVRMEPLTTRQRALQSGKGAATGGSLIEFPNGLPPATPRKQKEKLSEVEQAAKKAEAAQRRRMQVEKANRENEAEAIRKILGQDSSRKKKEEKIQKERDEMAQKKAADSLVLVSNTIRLVMGLNGTTITFGKEVGLPSIFKPHTCSYPPPREKCAGPSCTNTCKYRDSKLNIPLCSLLCYKAVHKINPQVSTC